ncbi:Protein kinase alk2 [Arthrobotrys megalospora]
MKQYIIGAVATLVAYIIWTKIDFALRERKFRRLHGTKPPTYLANSLPFGLDYVTGLLNHTKRQTVLEFMRGNYEEYGHTFAISILGKTTITTREPKNIQALLATQFKDFSVGLAKKGPFEPLLGEGIINIDGQKWEYTRSLLRPQFARNQITQLENLEEHFSVLLDCIPDGTASSVDLQELFFNLTMDTSTAFLFGESSDTLKHLALSPRKEDGGEEFLSGVSFVKALNSAQEHMFKRFCLKDMYGLHNPKEFKDAIKECHSYVDRYVKRAIERVKSGKGVEGGKYVFLDAVAADTQDPIILRDAAISLLIAGRDTTGSFLSFFFYLVVRHPEVQDKLRRTIYEEFGSNFDPQRITFESLKNCKYLRWVMDEVLRLYPVVPINGRTTIVDTTLPLGGGPDGKSKMFVPKGTGIEYSVYAMHRRTDIWGEDANWFRPERWENRPKTDALGWEYLPFNGGPRICIGQQFALTEAGYTIVRMFQEFKRFESGEMDPFVKCLSMLMTCVGGKGVLVRCYKE